MLRQKQIIIATVAIIGLLILGVLGTSLYFLLGKNIITPTKTQTSTTTVTSQNTQPSATSSLIDLITSGKTTKCTFDTTTETGSTVGTIYIVKDKMRADITTTDEDGKTSQIYMIRDGANFYIWGGSLPSGIKMTIDIKDLKLNTQANQYVDLNTKTEYKCGDWTPDSSKFILPSNIEFTDVSAMTGAASTPVNSSICEGIEDPEKKASCENALKKYSQ